MRRPLSALFVLFLFPILFPIAVQALPLQRDDAPVSRHYILESDVPLDASASAELAAEGIEVQQVLGNHRYLVRMQDGVSPTNDARIRSLRAYDFSRKIARAAYAEAASGKAFARLRIIFQPDVTLEAAQNAIEAVGGTIDTPFALASANPQRMTVRVPSLSLMTLAQDERVFGVYGPPLRPKSLNSLAASISHVTPLYSAPYNLNGDGVVLSIFEPDGAPDVAHVEFGGRVISHFDASRPIDEHATHVSGTLVAAGVNPLAKGMAPTATLHAFDANDDDFNTTLARKLNGPASVGSVADNNSWDFGLSWQDGNQWWGNEDAFGAYSALESEPYDKLMRTAGVPLIVHAAGNDAMSGNPFLAAPWFPHVHIEDQNANGGFPHTYCYSQNATGTDCPAPTCSIGTTYCETMKHPTHGATTTIGLLASTKNSVTVGALNQDGVSIADFSSLGPTTDGRVKPELVAMGVHQFSTFPGNFYSSALSGTSMATPVVTGAAALLTQQYRKTFGKTPTPPVLKTLLIAGADDLGPAGPDFTFGFGLIDAKASVDLIVADAGTGSRIRTGTIGNGQDVDIPVTLSAIQNFRAVLGWFDPEVLLIPDPTVPGDDPLAGKTLVNDLDLRVVDPNGATVLPYVLSLSDPSAVATRDVNHVDTTEEVEIANAIPGTYHVIVHGSIGDSRSSSQDYVVVMNGGTPCISASLGSLFSGRTVSAKLCGSTDVDTFTFSSNSLSPVSVTVAATDTPLKVTLTSNASATVSQNIAANSTATLSTSINSSTTPTPDVQFSVRVEATGTVGATGAYTVTPSFNFTTTARKRSVRH